MSGQDLFNELCQAEDTRGVVAALSDEALREVYAHIFREGESEGERAEICGVVAMESSVRFLEQRSK